jgi:phosphatidate cytidylyltransferase
MKLVSFPTTPLMWVLGGILMALAAGSIVRVIATRHADETLRRKRMRSLRTWWILVGAVCLGLMVGRLGVCLLLGTASMFGLKEFTRLVATRPCDKRAMVATCFIAVSSYALLLFAERDLWAVFTPLAAVLLISVEQLTTGQTEGYIRSTAGLVWGTLLLVYGVSHAVLLFLLPETASGPVGPAGWFLYLLVLTETNDIAQALIGRQFGAHKRHCITPRISPNKTWEGFLGGLAVTVILSVLLAPWLTGLTAQPVRIGSVELPSILVSAAAGLLIATLGFFGDINMSAIKRDRGVKDGSQLLPGMGGMIDRIDSLTYTAPAFVWFVRWLL